VQATIDRAADGQNGQGQADRHHPRRPEAGPNRDANRGDQPYRRSCRESVDTQRVVSMENHAAADEADSGEQALHQPPEGTRIAGRAGHERADRRDERGPERDEGMRAKTGRLHAQLAIHPDDAAKHDGQAETGGQMDEISRRRGIHW